MIIITDKDPIYSEVIMPLFDAYSKKMTAECLIYTTPLDSLPKEKRVKHFTEALKTIIDSNFLQKSYHRDLYKTYPGLTKNFEIHNNILYNEGEYCK